MRKTNQRDHRPFIGLHNYVLFGPDWGRLSSQARSLYLLLKGKRNPVKREEIKLSYREILKLKHCGLRRHSAISRSFKELEKAGWIERANPGGLYGGAQLYCLTGRFDEYGFKMRWRE